MHYRLVFLTTPRPTTSTTHCTAASWATWQPRCTSQCRQTEWRSCTLVRTSRCRPARPDGTVQAGNTAASALLLKHEFLDGGADVTLATLGRHLGRSLPDEELGGLEQAADLQQRGPQQRPGAAAAGNQSARVFLERDGRRTSASSS